MDYSVIDSVIADSLTKGDFIRLGTLEGEILAIEEDGDDFTLTLDLDGEPTEVAVAWDAMVDLLAVDYSTVEV